MTLCCVSRKLEPVAFGGHRKPARLRGGFESAGMESGATSPEVTHVYSGRFRGLHRTNDFAEIRESTLAVSAPARAAES